MNPLVYALAATLSFAALPAFAAQGKKSPAGNRGGAESRGSESHAPETRGPKESKLAGLPESVVTTIHALQNRGQIGDVDRAVQEGETVFEVEIMRGGVTRAYTLDTEGVVLSDEIFPEEVPAAALAAINTEAAGGKVESINRSLDDGQFVFDVEITKGWKTFSATFSATGRLVGRHVALADCPANIRAAVNAQLNGGKLGSFFHGTDRDGDQTYYGASIRSGRARWFSLDANGALSGDEEKLAWADVPPPVQQAIVQRQGGTDHLRVLRVTDGATSKFEVLATKGAKTSGFSFTPEGKIIPPENQ